MDAAPHEDGLRQKTTGRAAGDRLFGAGHTTFGDRALELLELGYEPLPLVPGLKRPAPTRWTQVRIDTTQVLEWARRFHNHGIGLRTGRLVGLDIDILDPELAHVIGHLARARLGTTLLRVGLWPKRLLLNRTETPFPKCSAGKVEWLGAGQQFVAFGRHPDSGRDYYWPDGETPLGVPLEDLPLVSEAKAHAFLAEAEALQPSQTDQRKASRAKGSRPEPDKGASGPTRDDDGRVTDGRDGWLSTIAFHAVHDAVDAEQTLDEEVLTGRVRERFAETTDTSRPKKDGASWYAECDARAKVRDKLRLHSDGHLPGRDGEPVEADYHLPTLDVAAARSRLDEVLAAFCEQVAAWHVTKETDPPKLAIRATVGLGKSRAARTHLVPLACRMRDAGLPHRVLVFTATHALAEETAAAWAAEGARVAVLRGYERTDPESGEPMCRDFEAVQAAFRSGLSAQSSICAPVSGDHCPFFSTCAKQANRRDVASADVVVAPYDALFSGLAFETDDIALLVIDEAVWPRALEHVNAVCVEDLATEPVSDIAPGSFGRGPEGAMADLAAARRKLSTALSTHGPGPVRRTALLAVGLTVEDCLHSARLEAWRKQDPGIGPGLTIALRQKAFAIAARNARVMSFVSIWSEVAAFLDSGQASSGRLHIRKPDSSGRHKLDLRRVKPMHESLRHRPVLISTLPCVRV
ncbi:hypothetical protein EF888_11165 [Silicimonas algicola]|uniref:Bifunctional DNA primase/polymerase-like protein n=1 Tax=Silicimonas algicola TaxID=1826607 RepID=A0A316FSD4_9RHOB|nr:bifunctional DNA primase/polymerase [Silicimonas algicola]AZQ67642.1 hypothetical protein EF888_11165 [Silicimonas algicola]PWK51678.1 bifunctional DNA primase/polymerase-like protein [Silicimonas algicola]